MIQAILEYFSSFTTMHYMILAMNLLLLMLARPIILKTASSSLSVRQLDFRVSVLRVLNLAILAAVFYNADVTSVSQSGKDDQGFAVKLIAILVALYLAYLASNIASYVMRRKYGKITNSGDDLQISDTYRSRMLTLVASSVITIIVLIAVIRIAGFSSMLEAGGAIGFVGVFLALTQQAWAPDIISGLVLLNSEMLNEGDLVEIGDSNPILARVFKTKIFHTVLIDIVNNHRIMISNAKLRDQTIHSLSKFASAKGLREKLTFKIGYNTSSNDVKTMLQDAFDSVADAAESSIDNAHPLEIRVIETGDHAVEWGVFYYIKDVSEIVAVRQQLSEEILESSHRHGISLSTPQIHVVTFESDKQSSINIS